MVAISVESPFSLPLSKGSSLSMECFGDASTVEKAVA